MFNFISRLFDSLPLSSSDSIKSDPCETNEGAVSAVETPSYSTEPSVFNGWGSGVQSACEASSISPGLSVTVETWGSIDSGSSFNTGSSFDSWS